MPFVFVPHRKLFGSYFYARLKTELRRQMSKELSIKGLPLGPEDFSFTFLPEGPDDELIKDLQILIFAHNDKFGMRVAKGDSLAEAISPAVHRASKGMYPRYVNQQMISFSIAIHMGAMSYNAGVADAS